MRKLLIPLHRYLGLVLGLLFSLQGLTGSLLVFDHALDERLNPDLLLTVPTAQPVALAKALAAAESAAPPGAVATLIELPRHSAGVHVIRFRAADGRRVEVTVDPYRGTPTSARTWGESGISWVYRLHYTLLSGQLGKNIVGVSGILLLSISVIGLYLWWPRRGRWRSVLKLRVNQGVLPLHYDLHRLLGALATPALVVISFAGICIVFAAAFHAASDPRLAVPTAQRRGARPAGPHPRRHRRTCARHPLHHRGLAVGHQAPPARIACGAARYSPSAREALRRPPHDRRNLETYSSLACNKGLPE
jgi:uncharacterized iron-regulated membrane protein